MKCDAIYPISGQCRNEGRVEIVSRDWPDEKVMSRFLFCFDCTQKALADGIFEEPNDG
jgi:hypothetical protein